MISTSNSWVDDNIAMPMCVCVCVCVCVCHISPFSFRGESDGGFCAFTILLSHLEGFLFLHIKGCCDRQLETTCDATAAGSDELPHQIENR